MLVNLPPNVGTCVVFRNVVTAAQEQLISEEITPLMVKEGQKLFVDTEKTQLKNNVVELFGWQQTQEFHNWRTRSVAKVRGLVWIPTLTRLLDAIDTGFAKYLPSPDGTVRERTIDAARFIELHQPGFEMHVEHPAMGTAFLLLNLLGDTIIELDDEATDRRGQVYLPSRGMMLLADELRWGWRWGERTATRQTFTGPQLRKVVDTDEIRLLVQLWHHETFLFDRHLLIEEIEGNLRKSSGLNEGSGTLPTSCNEEFYSADAPSLMNAMHSEGKGRLGGDLASESSDDQTYEGVAEKIASKEVDPSAKIRMMSEQFTTQKQHVHNVIGVIQKMTGSYQTTGEIPDDKWLKEQHEEIKKYTLPGERQITMENLEEIWDDANSKAEKYRAKLQSMDYDGSEGARKRTIDIGYDPDNPKPLDAKRVNEAFAPFMEASNFAKELSLQPSKKSR
jgi:hypothetical protein